MHCTEQNKFAFKTSFIKNVCFFSNEQFPIVPDNFKSVVCRFRNHLYLKDIEVDLKMTEKLMFLEKRLDLLIYFDKFLKHCIVLDETTVHI